MTLLFIRFYLSIVSVLFLAWFLYGTILDGRYQAMTARLISNAHGSGLRWISKTLDSLPTESREEAFRSWEREFRCPIEIRPLSELSASDRESLRSSDTATFVQWGRDVTGVAVAMNDHEYLRMGPLPSYEFIAIEDALHGWMRAIANSVDRSDLPAADAIHQVQDRFSLQVNLSSLDQLSPTDAARIRSGREVIFHSKPGDVSGETWFASTSLKGANQILTVGPFPKFNREERPAATTTLALVLLPSAFAIALLLRPITRQLRKVESVAKAIANGDLHARVDERHMGSARELARAFNIMASRTETMVRTQRDLLQAVSHELKTPLARIRFALDLAASAPDTAQRQKRLDAIDGAVEDLDGLVNELISYVRMENTNSHLDREPVSVLQVAETLVDQFQPLNPDVQFVILPQSPASQLIANADRTMMHRALGNLIGNAARFAASKVTLRLRAEGRHVFIDVDDDGPGIPESERSRVLEPFVRLDNQPAPSRHAGAGAGLGLSIVRQIVDRHGGSLEISASPEGGCRVQTSWGSMVP